MIDRLRARLDVPPDLAQVATARRFVRNELSDLVPAETLAELQLITSELVTNAIEHGEAAPVAVAISHDDDIVTITVGSTGPSPEVGPLRTWSIADVDEVSGRGLGLVRRLADRVSVEQTASRLTISAHRRISAAG